MLSIKNICKKKKMQKQNTFPDASYKPLNIPPLNYSKNPFNNVTVPHPNNINILPNNTACPYNLYPRIKPANAFGIAHTIANSKKRILLPGVLTGSHPSGVDTQDYFPRQNTMSGGSPYGND